MKQKIIKEDVGFNSDVTTTRVTHNANTGGGKASGGKKAMPANRIILRPPTKAEIQAADTNPSDYQIAQLRILSKILFDFGLISKVYRSKKATLNHDTRKQVQKYQQIFSLFCNTFNENEPIKNVRDTLDLVDNDDILSSDIVTVLNNIDSLNAGEKILPMLASIYKESNQYGSNYEPNQQDLNAVKEVYSKLNNVLITAQNNQHTLAEVKKRIQLANTINSYMKENIMQEANNLVYNDSSVKNVSDFQNDIHEYLANQSQEGKSVHANTALHEEAAKNLRALAVKLKKDGFEGGLTTKNVFEYLKANEPETIKWIASQYDLSEDELSGDNFPTWESLAKYFYQPEMIKKIENEQLNTQQRSRAIGDIRKGANLAVDAKAVARRKESLKKKIKGNVSDSSEAKSRIEELESRLEAKEKEYDEAKKIRDKIKSDLAEARNLEDKETVKELEDAYNKAKQLAFNIGKNVAAIRHSISKAKKNPDKEVKKSDIETLKELEKEEEKIFNKARASLDDNADIRDLEAQFDKTKNIDLGSFDLSEINYRTWSFILNTTNEKIVNYVIKELEKILPQATDGYFNVDAYEPEYDDLLQKGTEIIIDYPKESKLYKMFKKSPQLPIDLIKGLIQGIRKQFDMNVSFVKDEDKIKINEPF